MKASKPAVIFKIHKKRDEAECEGITLMSAAIWPKIKLKDHLEKRVTIDVLC